MDISEITELLAVLCEDKTVSKSVREALAEIKQDFDSEAGDVGVKVDSALARLEDLSIDPNLSADVRTKIWDLTSKLEGAANGK
ncbi:MAG: UPF0147 family protein [DPANN group archaeon]|nr:UPF0147 family protein [DPANN group archaeon]